MSQCRSCHATIFWGETPNGRRAPFDPDGQSHFITCPDRRAWRRESAQPVAEPVAEPVAQPVAPADPAPEPEQSTLFDAAEAPPKPEGSRYPV